MTKTRTNRLKICWYKKKPGLALKCRGRVVFSGSYESARHFAIGFGCPIDRRDVAQVTTAQVPA